MGNITWVSSFYGGSLGPYYYNWTTFIKRRVAPSGPTTIMDADGGVNGYLRSYIDSSMKVTVEVNMPTIVASLQSPALSLGQEYLLGYNTESWYISGTDRAYLNAVIYSIGGGVFWTATSSPGQVLSYSEITMVTRFGWGVSLSSGYNNNENDDTKTEYSKLWITGYGYPGTGGGGVSQGYPVPAPSFYNADPTPTAQTVLLCNCRQTAGSISTLNDDSGNSNNLSAGPNGATVNIPGPYP